MPQNRRNEKRSQRGQRSGNLVEDLSEAHKWAAEHPESGAPSALPEAGASPLLPKHAGMHALMQPCYPRPGMPWTAAGHQALLISALRADCAGLSDANRVEAKAGPIDSTATRSGLARGTT